MAQHFQNQEKKLKKPVFRGAFFVLSGYKDKITEPQQTDWAFGFSVTNLIQVQKLLLYFDMTCLSDISNKNTPFPSQRRTFVII